MSRGFSKKVDEIYSNNIVKQTEGDAVVKRCKKAPEWHRVRCGSGALLIVYFLSLLRIAGTNHLFYQETALMHWHKGGKESFMFFFDFDGQRHHSQDQQ